MRRDINLIRTLLIKVEREQKVGRSFISSDAIEAYNIALMIDAEFVDGTVEYGSGRFPIGATIFRLRWKGYEFLDTVREDSIWNDVVSTLKQQCISAPFNIILSVGMELLKKQISV